MDFPIPKRLPCSVCGLVSLRHEGWFLVTENRWLDHLKILTWHASLARDRRVHSACCRQHLKVLIAYWLEEASLRLASPPYRLPLPLAGIPDHSEMDIDSLSVGRLVGELSVSREPLSRSWAGSPEALECILDALIPEPREGKPSAAEARVLELQQPMQPARPSPEFVLY